MFDKIMENARKGYEENLETQKAELKKESEVMDNYSVTQRIRMEAEDKNWIVLNQIPDESVVYSENLLNIVRENEYKVIEYGKRLDSESFYDEYCAVSEYYLVEKNNYRFIIKHLEDVDIDEGIFAVYEVVNILSDEKIEFYVDLGCRNTGEELFEDFKLLISCDSKEDYMNKKYKKYYDIETKLVENGFKILSKNYNFSTRNSHAFLQVHEKAYVVIYKAWMDELKVVVTNNKTWDVNSSNNLNNIGYYVDYDENNFDVLVETIKAFVKHITGEFGFFEDGIYYNNAHLRKFYEYIYSKKDDEGHTPEIFNHYHVQFKKVDGWDCRGYNSPHYINVYNGLEIADHRKLILNDAAQWSVGNIVNVSDIIFKYDKNIDTDNCILMIRNYQYDKTEDDFYWTDDKECIDEFFVEEDAEKYLVGSIEFRGAFFEVLRQLYAYIIEICKKFNIDILRSDFLK